MPFHFKPSESPARAVRRVCHECVSWALERLQKPYRPAAIHSVRKEIKKLRAIFQLVRREIGGRAYRQGRSALREAANHLGVPRDARVMLKAFEQLTADQARLGGIEAELRKHSHGAANRFQKGSSVARAEKLLRKTGRRAAGLKIKTPGWAALEPGFKESYRGGHAACELAGREPDSENFHEWRKQVKHLWYYFRLLGPALDPAARRLRSGLKLLGDLLGDEHDLFLLQQFVAVHCEGMAGEKAVLNKLMAARRRELRSAALKLGSRLYAGTPRAVCRRLEKCWNKWHTAEK